MNRTSSPPAFASADYRKDKGQLGDRERPTLGQPRCRCLCLAPTCRGFIF